MAVIVALKKIMHTKGLTASLLFGMLLAGALVALVPSYAGMSLNRTFIKELETYQKETGIYPGMALVTAFFNENNVIDVLKELELSKNPAFSDQRIQQLMEQRRGHIQQIRTVLDSIPDRMSLESQIRIDNLASITMQITVQTPRGKVSTTGKLQSLTSFEENSTILRGTSPSMSQDGIYEAVATEATLAYLGIELGGIVSVVPRLDGSLPPIRIRIVGTFDVNQEKSLAWNFFKPVMFRDSLLLRMEDAEEILMGTPMLTAFIRTYIAFDYREMLAVGLRSLSNIARNLDRDLFSYSADFEVPVLTKTEALSRQENTLKTTLWMLNIPVLIMLFMYMAMVSGMVVDNDSGEIALLVSRGGSQKFIFTNYLVKGLILAVVAYVFSLPLSTILTRVLGSVNGFLSFVRRGIPQVHLGLESYLFCAAALILAVLMLSVPAARKQGISIVQQKRSIGRVTQRPLWNRLGLDIFFLAASLTAWYLLQTRPKWLSSSSGDINPLVFALMPCFVVAATLSSFRIYPLLIKFIYRLGRKLWRAGTYLTLLRIARNSGRYLYIMVFLSLTIAIGIFSATAARTLNDNESDQIAYLIGSDMKLAVNWPRQGSQNIVDEYSGQENSDMASGQTETRRFQEPSFSPFKELAGVQSATRVFERSAVQVAGVRTTGNVDLMGIVPADFGRTAWYRNDLFSSHFHSYLNAMAMDERNILISSSLSDRLDLRMGDWVTLKWEGSDSATFHVVGIINYWPGWDTGASVSGGDASMLVVADLNAVQSLLAIEPYYVWLKLEKGADLQALFSDMSTMNIRPTFLRSFQQENIALINGGTRIAVNGAMSLGFIASCIICALGFLLYWQMYLRKNQLQLGLQRSMGFTVGQLMRMLSLELILTSVVALFWGVLIGIIGSRMFVPLFEFSAAQMQAPPFRVRMLAQDRVVIYAIIAVILIICWTYLALKVKWMKVTQAIKLGED